VAGADRLALSEHIVFDDLLALARFCLFPDDDLTLAALLRSPFCDVEDESLYRLAHGRKGTLWQALCARSGEQADWTAAGEVLAEAMSQARTQRPFEFYSRMLGFRSLRSRLLRRLGGEAEDALDEFLNQVLAAEARGVEDLESLAAAFAGLDITVKREMESVRNEVRVMTAHGAKGLEASIVFLPETTSAASGRNPPLIETEAGGFLWCATAKQDCEASASARERRAKAETDESWRLLYVALTRARERLVLCGRLPGNRKEENLKGWWGLLSPVFDAESIAPQVRSIACGDLQIRRFGPDPRTLGHAELIEAPVSPLPAWADVAPAAEAFARYASPSDLGEDAAAPAASPLSAAGGLGRFRRGDLIHRLLQLLPDIPARERAAGAAALMARESDLTDPQRAEMASAALSVLEDERFAGVFGEGSRAEVAIAGTGQALPPGLKISGRIDRLVVLPDRVLVVDFKTNRPSPDRIEAADPAYLRQMAFYAAVLADIFEGRRIEAAIVWTDGPKLMAVPENLLAQTLADLRRAG
jgi:ATP-dependent helicase/nuclease subunit A